MGHGGPRRQREKGAHLPRFTGYPEVGRTRALVYLDYFRMTGKPSVEKLGPGRRLNFKVADHTGVDPLGLDWGANPGVQAFNFSILT